MLQSIGQQDRKYKNTVKWVSLKNATAMNIWSEESSDIESYLVSYSFDENGSQLAFYNRRISGFAKVYSLWHYKEGEKHAVNAGNSLSRWKNYEFVN